MRPLPEEPCAESAPGESSRWGELGAALGLGILRGEALEGALARLLEEEQNRHELARTQPGRAVAQALP
jgi:hypothetical protein